jgi:hypothetical protein
VLHSEKSRTTQGSLTNHSRSWQHRRSIWGYGKKGGEGDLDLHLTAGALRSKTCHRGVSIAVKRSTIEQQKHGVSVDA